MDEVTWLDELSDEHRRTMSEQRFRVGDTDYVATIAPNPSPTYLSVVKPPVLVEQTAALARRFRGGNIVEIGIRHGGSTALLTQIAQPRKLVAIELSTAPLDRLEAFLDVGDRRDVVHPHFGVDQSDRERLGRILDEEFGGEPIDLVIDDASHLPD
jgi:predicted O-methyltransferase YrrM